MSIPYRACIATLGGLLAFAAARPLCAQPFFVGIGDLGGNSNGSSAMGVSADGMVVVGMSYRPVLYSEVVLWTAQDGMRSLTPGRASLTSGGVSGRGGVVVGAFPGNSTVEAFRWTALDGAVSLGDLAGGAYRSSALGTSARGDIVVGYSSSDRSTEDSVEAFRWTADAGMIGLGGLPGGGFASVAEAISANGRVIVGAAKSPGGNEAFLWTVEKGMLGLGDLPGGSFNGRAIGVSAEGAVVVGIGFDAEGQKAFRWTEQTGVVALPKIHPSQIYQRASGTSWDGDVIVGEAYASDGGGVGAFYWTPEGGTRWLTDVLSEHSVIVPGGWHLQNASAVSADGRTIVGTGTSPQGRTEGWVASLGPGCRADYDKSGSVEPDDVAAYLAAWLQRSIFADWNYDGGIDTRDLIAFLDEWAGGC